MNVVGYARVSTEEQASEGVSLAAQRTKLEAFAGLHGLALIAIEEDGGASAKSLQRPGLARALDALSEGKAEGILVAKLDRLTRSVVDLHTLIERHFSEPAGRHLMSVAESIDTRTAGGRMVLFILTIIAQWERETIVERTTGAHAHKRSRGEAVGPAPYGKRLDPDDPRRSKGGRPVALADDLAELEAIGIIRRLAAEGRSLRLIAGWLQVLGLPTKRGGPWTFSSVRKILARAS